MAWLSELYPIQHAAFALLAVAVLWPQQDGTAWRVLGLAGTIEVIVTLRTLLSRSTVGKTALSDASAVIFLFLLSWHLLTARLNLLDPMLIPPPDAILKLFWTELPDMVHGLKGSLFLLVSGYGLALVTAIPLGLIIGWNGRIYSAAIPFAKVLGTIPPVVYIPYAIHFLPSFKTASVMVIFIGAFWPLFINTLSGVSSVPQGLIDSARVLNLSTRKMLFRVVLPAALPSICTGATLALCFSFLMLTAAEVIGGSSGIGWYVSNFADFADYARVIVGIIFIGIVVTVITLAAERLERHLLRWRV
ncbi:ABC transporter permease [Rhodomicrobium sp.]|uniref:ABC transporter permease n=1 Tax=Rhodomicrobium sp. TaxID=2720632 RepID=UPI0039E4D142